MISLIVPAHNESGTIRPFVESLVGPAHSSTLDVVVVCNGCTDGTAEEAQSAVGCRVVDIETPSKAVAMQVGDDMSTEFPRFYVDADIAVTPEQLQRLADALDGGLLAVAPSVTYDVSRSSLAVRAYFRALSRLPAQMSGISGTGCMGLSREGRERFGSWPVLLADDYYLDGLFAPHEKARLAEVTVVVRAPRGLQDLVKRKLRTLRGNRQVDLEQPRPHPVQRGGGIKGIVRAEPRRLIDVLVFVGVSSWCRFRLLRGGPPTGEWARDRSREA